MANTYFLRIDGIDGGSTDKAHNGWFEIDAYDFEIMRAAATGGGGGLSKATFDPLVVTADLSLGLTALFDSLTSGKVIKAVELEGVNSTGGVFYDLTLSDAGILKVDDGNDAKDTVAFDYAKVDLVTTEFDGTGKQTGTPHSFSWDLKSSGGTFDTTGIASLGDDTAAEASSAQYFLFISGVTGDSTDKAHKGWFEIDSYDFEVFRTLATGGGGGASQPTFDPLAVTAEFGAGIANLLALAADGTILKSVEVEGVNSSGSVFYNIELADAGILRVDEGNNAKDTVAFDFEQVTVTTTTPSSSGGAPATQSFSWNVAKSGGTFDTTGLASLGDDTPAEASSNQYFLRIDGIDGGSADKAHKGWFEIDAYDFEIMRAAATGGGISKATFDPLVVTADLSLGLTALFDSLTSGKVFKSVELEGVNSSGGVFYDLTLSDASILKVDEGNSAKDTVAFDFEEVTVTTTTPSSSGGAPTQQSFSWNVAKSGGAFDTTGLASLGDDTPAEASSNQYFLYVDGVDGGSTDKAHKGWFEIDSYDFEVFRTIATTGGGGSTSQQTFDPLAVTAEFGAGIANLLALAADGTILKSVEVEGVNSSGSVFYNIALADAGILRVDEGNNAKDTVAFDFEEVTVTTTTPSSSGGAPTQQSFSWNVAKSGGAFDTTGLASLGDDTPAEASSDQYFLRIDGIDGGSADKAHKGWFEIDAYDFEIMRAAATGGGGGVSKATFDPLVVTADLREGLAELIDLLTSGKVLKAIELEGVNSQGGVFYDLTLSDAGILKVDEGNNAKDTVAFDYSRIDLTTTEFDAKGKQTGIPQSFSWDLKSGGTIDTTGIASLGDDTPAEASSDQYFLYVDGIDGGSAAKNHVGWFEIDSYDFEVFRTIATTGGGGGSSVTFNPLIVTADLGPGIADLYDELSSGKFLKTVIVEGVNSTGGVFYKLELSSASVEQVSEDAGKTAKTDTVAFSYASFVVNSNETVVQVPGDSLADRGVATAAEEHFIGVDLGNPAKPLKLVTYADSTAGVVIDLSTNTSAASAASGGFAQGDYFTSINAVEGSGHSDTIKGDGAGNKLIGGLGTDFLSGGAGDDTFVVRAGDTASGETYDGGANQDTLQIEGGGTVDLTGVIFSDMENIVTTGASGTRVILSTGQVNAFSGAIDAQGADDTFVVSNLAFLTTFATPATRASAFALIKELLDGGVESVEWQEGGAINIANLGAGNTVVITSEDPAGTSGGLSWATSEFVFDGTTGSRLTKTTFNDDGTTVARTFNVDVLVSDVTTAIPGLQNTRTVQYDTAGRWDSLTVTYDAGGSTRYEYDDAGRVDSRIDTAADDFVTTTYFNDSNQRLTVTSDDSLSNRYSWMSSTLTLNPLTGQVEQKFTVLDDGNTVIENYQAGVLSTRITQDGGANEAFTTSRQFYPGGVFSYQATSYDNGTGLIIGTDAANTMTTLYGIADAIIGKGGADTFVFDFGMGADRILDFQDGLDRLDFRTLDVDSLADLANIGAAVSQAGADVVVNLGDGDVLTIKNFILANFTDADFLTL